MNNYLDDYMYYNGGINPYHLYEIYGRGGLGYKPHYIIGGTLEIVNPEKINTLMQGNSKDMAKVLRGYNRAREGLISDINYDEEEKIKDLELLNKNIKNIENQILDTKIKESVEKYNIIPIKEADLKTEFDKLQKTKQHLETIVRRKKEAESKQKAEQEAETKTIEEIKKDCHKKWYDNIIEKKNGDKITYKSNPSEPITMNMNDKIKLNLRYGEKFELYMIHIFLEKIMGYEDVKFFHTLEKNFTDKVKAKFNKVELDWKGTPKLTGKQTTPFDGIGKKDGKKYIFEFKMYNSRDLAIDIGLLQENYNKMKEIKLYSGCPITKAKLLFQENQSFTGKYKFQNDKNLLTSCNYYLSEMLNEDTKDAEVIWFILAKDGLYMYNLSADTETFSVNSYGGLQPNINNSDKYVWKGNLKDILIDPNKFIKIA